jgi:recombination protein RecA
MGTWYELDGNKIGQGRDNVKNYLKNNPEVCEDLLNRIKNGIVG